MNDNSDLPETSIPIQGIYPNDLRPTMSNQYYGVSITFLLRDCTPPETFVSGSVLTANGWNGARTFLRDLLHDGYYIKCGNGYMRTAKLVTYSDHTPKFAQRRAVEDLRAAIATGELSLPTMRKVKAERVSSAVEAMNAYLLKGMLNYGS